MGPERAPQMDKREDCSLRIGFADGAQDDFHLSKPQLGIGADPDNDIVLEESGMAARHLTIEFRHRCWMLFVADGAERVHVNARPVRQMALLRLGDVISLGGRKLILLPAREQVEVPVQSGNPGDASTSRQQAGLRCVAGPLSGRFLLLQPDLQLDHLLLPGMDGCVRVRAANGGVSFEQMSEGTVQPACNGIPAKRAVMREGDQLSWGRHRFVLEASPLPDRSQSHADSGSTPVVEPAADSGSDTHELGWLLGVAAVLAACIAVLLLLRQ
ncbi:MAG: FHA domain-containing protein [Rhodanobacteraceae bacterium]